MQIRSPTPPDMPGEKWHRETYEESMKAKKPKAPLTVFAPEDHTRDDSGWIYKDDSGWSN